MESEKQSGKAGFYDTAFSLEEVTDLLNLAMENGLDDEIAAVRIATRRTLKKLEGEMETADFVKLVGLVHKGAGTVAGLLRTRRAISGEAADGLANAIAQIIQELATERDWKIF
jgi:hypothetical protein